MARAVDPQVTPGGCCTGDPSPGPTGWCVYVLQCRGDYLYTGSTNSLSRRLKEHENGTGSKFVRSRLPFTLVKVIPCETEREARQTEYRIKKLRRKAKLQLLDPRD